MGRGVPSAPMFVAVVALLLVGSGGCVRSTGLAASPSPGAAVEVVRISGSGTAMPIVRKLAEAYRARQGDIQFQFESGANSGGPLRAVAQGNLDLAASNRPLTAAEQAEGLSATEIAREAIVFAANQAPEVSALTTALVKDVYAGRITTWDALGGPAEPIILLDRDADETQRKLVVLPLLDHHEPEALVTVLYSSPDMLRALASTPGSLGYTGYGLLKVTETLGPRALALDGVAPGPDTVANGSYPWYLTLSLVSGPHSPPAARRFAEFARGSLARTILVECGYAAP